MLTPILIGPSLEVLLVALSVPLPFSGAAHAVNASAVIENPAINALFHPRIGRLADGKLEHDFISSPFKCALFALMVL